MHNLLVFLFLLYRLCTELCVDRQVFSVFRVDSQWCPAGRDKTLWEGGKGERGNIEVIHNRCWVLLAASKHGDNVDQLSPRIWFAINSHLTTIKSCILGLHNDLCKFCIAHTMQVISKYRCKGTSKICTNRTWRMQNMQKIHDNYLCTLVANKFKARLKYSAKILSQQYKMANFKPKPSKFFRVLLGWCAYNLLAY